MLKTGIDPGMNVADARAIVPGLKVIDDKPGWSVKLLNSFAKFCIRYTPCVAIDEPDGLILEITGSAHLWGGDLLYITTIIKRFKSFRYDVKAAIADTIVTAWVITRFHQSEMVIQKDQQFYALLFYLLLLFGFNRIPSIFCINFHRRASFYFNNKLIFNEGKKRLTM